MVREMKHTEIGDIPADWELQTFEETFSILSNNTLSRENLNNRGGAVRNIHYGDILTQFTEVLDCAKDDIPYVNDLSLLTSSTQLLQDGDIVIADTAEDETVGKVTEVRGLRDGKVVAGLHTIPCRVKKGDFAPGWLGYYMNSHMYHDQIVPFITGIKVSSISKSAMAETLIAVPPRDEQREIIEMLSQIDVLIQSQQKVSDKIAAVKLGCLSKMFPKEGKNIPEMRLPEFSDPWEQRKLGEICQVTMGQSPDGTTYSDEPSDYILVQGNADLKDGWVFPRIWTTQKTKTAQAYDLIMSVRAPAGAIGKTAYDVVLGRGVAGIKGNEFIYQSLAKFDADGYWKKIAAGSTFESVNSDEVKNAIISIPQDIEEQEKIGEYFSNLDHFITLHQHKLEKYKAIKQGMMNELLTGKIRLV